MCIKGGILDDHWVRYCCVVLFSCNFVWFVKHFDCPVVVKWAISMNWLCLVSYQHFDSSSIPLLINELWYQPLYPFWKVLYKGNVTCLRFWSCFTSHPKGFLSVFAYSFKPCNGLINQILVCREVLVPVWNGDRTYLKLQIKTLSRSLTWVDSRTSRLLLCEVRKSRSWRIGCTVVGETAPQSTRQSLTSCHGANTIARWSYAVF